MCSSHLTDEFTLIENAQLILEHEARLQIDSVINLVEKSKFNNKTKIKYLRRLEGRERVFANKGQELYRFKKENFLIDCKLNGISQETCFERFFEDLNHKFFTCFIFKSPSDLDSAQHVGQKNGLSVILKGSDYPVPELYNAWSNYENTRSMFVALHQPNTLPNMIDNVIGIKPGHSTSIAFTQQSIKRLSTPNSDCIKGKYTDVGGEQFKVTESICAQLCEITYIYKKCKCITIETAATNLFQPNNNDTYCMHIDHSNITDSVRRGMCEVEALENIGLQQEVKICYATCKWNCEEINYDYTVSTSQWPEPTSVEYFIKYYIAKKSNTYTFKKYYGLLEEFYNLQSPENKTTGKAVNIYDGILMLSTAIKNGLSVDDILKNITIKAELNPSHKALMSFNEARIKWVRDCFYRLNIYFKQPLVEVHAQVLNYSFADLWSGVGGVCGLWAGVSVITGLEFLEFLTELLRAVLNPKTKVKTNKDDT